MYRIRFHGRGGQGIKTASRILGTAFFLEGFEVQDAPRYGAERRGAPIFAYVRAARQPILERGPIKHADIVVVADDTLVAVPNAGVMDGLTDETWLLIATDGDKTLWADRIKHTGPLVCLPPPKPREHGFSNHSAAACTGAAACLLGALTKSRLEDAVREELAGQSAPIVAETVRLVVDGYDAMTGMHGSVGEGRKFAVEAFASPDWIDVPVDDVSISAPAIHAAGNSVEVRTGLWRTLRPVIDYERCNRCNWVCSTFCPDNAISVDSEGYPHIDLEHCKGCMICVAQCPPHAITEVLEKSVAAQEQPQKGDTA